MDKPKSHLEEAVLVLAIVSPFFFCLSRYINIDFWYDEAFSLQHFVFVPIKTTVTDYSFPNNHIFFNVINSIYLKAIGVGDIFSLMDWPFKIRLLPLIFAIGAMSYLYMIGRKFFNKDIARLSLIVLVTTIPYYNFAVQVRGYGLSIFLLCMLLYHSWNFERHLRSVDAFLIVLASALSLYTIPLNLYFIAGLIIFNLSLWAGGWKSRSKSEKSGGASEASGEAGRWRNLCRENRQFVIAFLAGLGIVLAFLLYLPVIDDVTQNRFVESHGLFHAPTLLITLPRTLHYFLSGRFLLIPAFIVGCFAYVVFDKDTEPQLTRKAASCAILLALPFVLSFIRGDRPWLRVFVNLAPLFALSVSTGIYFLYSSLPDLRSKGVPIAILMLVYCNVTFAYSVNGIHERIRSDIEAGRKSQDIYYNYYQAHYNPLKLAGSIAESGDAGPKSWERLVLYDCDEAAMPAYLAKFAIGFAGREALEPMLNSQERVYVVTAFPNNFEEMAAETYPQFDCERLNERLQFHNLFVLTRTVD